MALTKITKAILKPGLHIIAVAVLTFIFIYVNKSSVINESTPLSPTFVSIIDFIVSLNGFWALPILLLILVLAALDFSDYKDVRGWLYRAYLFILGLLTGKTYTMGALYMAYSFSSSYVTYLDDLKNPFVIGASSVLLGLVLWFGGRALALKILRWRSNKSFKPKPLRGSA